jgi:hypothetical protein
VGRSAAKNSTDIRSRVEFEKKYIAKNNKIVSEELSEEDIKGKGHGPL